LIKLLPEECRELEARARKYTSPYRDVVRAKIVLAGGARLVQRSHRCTLGPAAPDCASGENASTRMASRASVSSHEVGLPPAFPPNLVVQVKGLACELPHRLGLPLSRLSIGAILTLRPRPVVSLTSMSASGRASPWAPMTS
jgi:hypothetical protein